MPDIQQIKEKIKQLMIEHKVDDYGVEYFTAKKLWGYCDYKRRMLGFNLMHLHANDWQSINDLILHEIAHALADKRYGYENIKGHGKEWKAICREIGCIPRATTSSKQCNLINFGTKSRWDGKRFNLTIHQTKQSQVFDLTQYKG